MRASYDNEVYRGITNHITELRRYARSLTRNENRADDLLQESLTRSLSKSYLYREGTNLRAWLFTILYRQHISSVRQEKRAGISVSPDFAVGEMATPPGQEITQVAKVPVYRDPVDASTPTRFVHKSRFCQNLAGFLLSSPALLMIA